VQGKAGRHLDMTAHRTTGRVAA